MQRRHLLISLVAVPVIARAHHGWSGFDQDQPLFLQGTARKVAWRNPHAEFDLENAADRVRLGAVDHELQTLLHKRVLFLLDHRLEA